jgi:topoisomerase-4 subunit B
MNPLQLRETTMAPDTRRLVRLEPGDSDDQLMDMLLAKKRARDRRDWLEAARVPLDGVAAPLVD